MGDELSQCSTQRTAGGKMKTTCTFLFFLFLLSVSSCSQGTVDTCTPKCDGKQCGDDQCGGTCPPGCEEDETCDGAGQCTLDADTTPPSGIIDLSASDMTLDSITLTWTAPGDDGTIGTASEYDIRYATASITEANWASATEVSNEPAPLVSGTSQMHIVSGLSPDTTYYFAIKTTDDAGNVSALSNVEPGKTLADSGVFQFYPSDYYWYVPVDTLQVHPASANWIAKFTPADAGNVAYLWTGNGDTINIVNSSTPKKVLTFRLYGTQDLMANNCGDANSLYPISPTLDWSGIRVDGENYYIMLDPDTQEWWQTYDGRLNYKCVNETLVASPGDMCVNWAKKYPPSPDVYALNKPGCSATGISGLDFAPGIIRKAEIDAGVIQHALVGSPYRGGFSIWPSRAWPNATFPNGDPNDWPPFGSRFRLKASFDISGFTATQQIVLRALKKYGFIIVDNGGFGGGAAKIVNINVKSEKSIRATLFGTPTQPKISVSNFEAVDTMPLMIDIDSGKCRMP
jgi:hypothetical protein